LKNAVRRLDSLARRHRRGDEAVSAAAVIESAQSLDSRMTNAGHTQRAPPANQPVVTPSQELLTDLLVAVRSLAESTADLVCIPLLFACL
jgi:hypothetical protein